MGKKRNKHTRQQPPNAGRTQQPQISWKDRCASWGRKLHRFGQQIRQAAVSARGSLQPRITRADYLWQRNAAWLLRRRVLAVLSEVANLAGSLLYRHSNPHAQNGINLVADAVGATMAHHQMVVISEEAQRAVRDGARRNREDPSAAFRSYREGARLVLCLYFFYSVLMARFPSLAKTRMADIQPIMAALGAMPSASVSIFMMIRHGGRFERDWRRAVITTRHQLRTFVATYQDALADDGANKGDPDLAFPRILGIFNGQHTEEGFAIGSADQLPRAQLLRRRADSDPQPRLSSAGTEQTSVLSLIQRPRGQSAPERRWIRQELSVLQRHLAKLGMVTLIGTPSLVQAGFSIFYGWEADPRGVAYNQVITCAAGSIGVLERSIATPSIPRRSRARGLGYAQALLLLVFFYYAISVLLVALGNSGALGHQRWSLVGFNVLSVMSDWLFNPDCAAHRGDWLDAAKRTGNQSVVVARLGCHSVWNWLSGLEAPSLPCSDPQVVPGSVGEGRQGEDQQSSEENGSTTAYKEYDQLVTATLEVFKHYKDSHSNHVSSTTISSQGIV